MLCVRCGQRWHMCSDAGGGGRLGQPGPLGRTSLQYDGLLGPMVGVVAMTWGYSAQAVAQGFAAPGVAVGKLGNPSSLLRQT